MKINNFELGRRTFIIAEIGNNHNGCYDTAKKMVQEAAEAGADAVKFQTFTPELYVHKEQQVVAHAQGVHKTQIERLKSLQLTPEQYWELKGLSDSLNIEFFSTPFDLLSVDFLDDLVNVFKIASGDVTNIPLLKHVASKNKSVILSTGMANEEEIGKAIAFFPKESIALLHCVARYPTPIDAANLLSIDYLRDVFDLPVGYSDHTDDLLASQTAVALSAVIIEKHFTLDKNQELGDHKFSMIPSELKKMVQSIRQIESSLGQYGKVLSEEEKNSAKVMRRSLYAKENINKGVRITSEMLVAIRPPGGLAPGKMDLILGKKANVDIKKDVMLSLEMFDLTV